MTQKELKPLPPEPRADSIRLYRNAQGGPINQRIDYLEYTRFQDGSATFMAHHVDGSIRRQQSWTFKDAESLVGTGNWKLTVMNPYMADKPDDYSHLFGDNKEAW